MYEEPLDKEEAINAARGKLDYIDSNQEEFETLGYGPGCFTLITRLLLWVKSRIRRLALRDSSDSESLTYDTVLSSVVVNEETFIDELTNILTVASDKHEGKFIKKEDVSYLDIQMDDLLKKLNFYYLNKSREEAKRIAEERIDILNRIGTDNTVYPVYRIKQIWLRNHGKNRKKNATMKYEVCIEICIEILSHSYRVCK